MGHMDMLVSRLVSEVDAKNKHLKEMEDKYNEISLSLSRALREKEKLYDTYMEETRRMQVTIHGISLANEKLKMELESLRKEVEHQKNGVGNDSHHDHEIERVHDYLEKVKNGSATMKGKSQVLKDRGVDWEFQDIDVSTEENEEDPEFLNTLIMKERMHNDELQEARKELIKGLEGLLCGRTLIGIRRMGEINEKPFYNTCLRRFPNEVADIKSAELCSLWQDHIRNSTWYPFKITTIDGKLQEILDDDDQKLKALRKDWGEEAYNAVAATLLEMNEYNPSGRYSVPELWNFKERRRASLKEAIQYLIMHMKNLKASKRRKLAGCSSGV